MAKPLSQFLEDVAKPLAEFSEDVAKSLAEFPEDVAKGGLQKGGVASINLWPTFL